MFKKIRRDYFFLLTVAGSLGKSKVNWNDL